MPVATEAAVPGLLARMGITGVNLPEWHPTGACNSRLDLDWYSEDPAEIAAVKAVCADCPIQTTCLDDAVERREAWGVWGGLDETERAAYAKEAEKPAPTIASHGERTRYVGTKKTPGCRCELCTRAHADYEHARRTNVAARGANWVPPRKDCAHCGSSFVSKGPMNVYCSSRCGDIVTKARAKQRDAEAREARHRARRCCHCSALVYPRVGSYCSEDCASCRDICGEKNPSKAKRELKRPQGQCVLCKEMRPAGRHGYCDDDCRELAALYAADRKAARVNAPADVLPITSGSRTVRRYSECARAVPQGGGRYCSRECARRATNACQQSSEMGIAADEAA